MKETKKKHGHHSSIFEEKGEVGHVLRNHNTSVQDYSVNHPRKILSLFLLFKLIYAGVIFSIMVYKSNMTSGDKICEGLFWFMAIAACICFEDFAERTKLKIAKSNYGAKTFIIMVAYAVYILCCCILRYDNQMDNMELLFILTLMSITNEVLQIVDCVYSEQKNYTKLSGFKYTWMILLPILLTLQIYGNLPFNHAMPFILGNFIAIIVEESTSMLFLSGIFPGYYIY
jgi:membrane protein